MFEPEGGEAFGNDGNIFHLFRSGNWNVICNPKKTLFVNIFHFPGSLQNNWGIFRLFLHTFYILQFWTSQLI